MPHIATSVHRRKQGIRPHCDSHSRRHLIYFLTDWKPIFFIFITVESLDEGISLCHYTSQRTYTRPPNSRSTTSAAAKVGCKSPPTPLRCGSSAAIANFLRTQPVFAAMAQAVFRTNTSSECSPRHCWCCCCCCFFTQVSRGIHTFTRGEKKKTNKNTTPDRRMKQKEGGEKTGLEPGKRKGRTL